MAGRGRCLPRWGRAWQAGGQVGASMAPGRPGQPGNLEGIQPSAQCLVARPWGGLCGAGSSHRPLGPARDWVPKGIAVCGETGRDQITNDPITLPHPPIPQQPSEGGTTANLSLRMGKPRHGEAQRMARAQQEGRTV